MWSEEEEKTNERECTHSRASVSKMEFNLKGLMRSRSRAMHGKYVGIFYLFFHFVCVPYHSGIYSISLQHGRTLLIWIVIFSFWSESNWWDEMSEWKKSTQWRCIIHCARFRVSDVFSRVSIWLPSSCRKSAYINNACTLFYRRSRSSSTEPTTPKRFIHFDSAFNTI